MEKQEKISDEENQPEKSTAREVLDLVIYIVIVALACYLIVTFVGQRTEVSGTSMAPTLQNGDNLIVDKLSYRFRDPERFDVIVLKYLHKADTHYIKRIIGLPGETVQIKDGQPYINGELLESDIYGSELMLSAGRASEPITLGEDEYFVLGDNRNGSKDSRTEDVGNVKKSQIVGKAFVRIWPLNKIQLIQHQ